MVIARLSLARFCNVMADGCSYCTHVCAELEDVSGSDSID